jgi:hypothetical protein
MGAVSVKLALRIRCFAESFIIEDAAGKSIFAVYS